MMTVQRQRQQGQYQQRLLKCGLCKNRKDLPRIAREKFGLRGEAVEVGVREGIYAKAIILGMRPSRMHLVDPWRQLPPEEYDDNSFSKEHITTCKRRMQEFSDIVTYHITVSDDAVKRFPDESLDFVYIDPNHSYKHAYHDTFAWWEIVTPNGILAGHDMFNPQYPGVTQAVLELCEAYKLTAYIIPEEVNKDGKKIVDPSWYILKGEGSETHFCQEGGEL